MKSIVIALIKMLAMGIVSLLLAPAAAYAGTIPHVYVTGYLTLPVGKWLRKPGTVTGRVCDALYGCANETASASYFGGSGSAYVSGDAASARGARFAIYAIASADVRFYFEVVGPTNISVPLIFSASGSTSANGSDALAQVDVGGMGLPSHMIACSATGASLRQCRHEIRSHSTRQRICTAARNDDSRFA